MFHCKSAPIYQCCTLFQVSVTMQASYFWQRGKGEVSFSDMWSLLVFSFIFIALEIMWKERSWLMSARDLCSCGFAQKLLPSFRSSVFYWTNPNPKLRTTALWLLAKQEGADHNSTVSPPTHTESPELPLLERGHQSIRAGREEEQGNTPEIKLKHWTILLKASQEACKRTRMSFSLVLVYHKVILTFKSHNT